MKSLFDYIYYRIYIFFSNQNDNVPETKGSVLLTVLQSFSVISLIVIVRFFWLFPLPHKFVLIPFVILLGILNWYRYERNLDIKELEKRWQHEVFSVKKTRGWLIVCWFIIVVLIPVSVGVLTHNFKVL